MSEQSTGIDSIAGWAYALLLAAMLFGFSIVSSLPVALHLAPRPFSATYRALICLISLISLAAGFKINRPRIDSRVQWCIGALTTLLLVRMFWDSNVVALPLDLPWSDYWLQVLGTTLIPALAFFIVPKPSWISRAHGLCVWLGLAAAFAIFYSVLQSVLHSFAGSGRLQTDVLNPIAIGTTGVSMYIVASTFERAAGALARIGRMLTIIIGIMLCVLSASKGPLLELAVIILLQYCFPAHRASMRRRISLAVLLAMALAAVAIVAEWASGGGELAVVARIARFGTDESSLERLQMWRAAVEQFNMSPLVGDAFVETVFRGYPHNDFIESMMATGFVGLLLLIVLTVTGIVLAFRQLRSPEYRWLVLLFLQTLINEQTSGSLYFSQTFWVMILVVIATAPSKSSPAYLAGKQLTQ